jgi:hypothetical protein
MLEARDVDMNFNCAYLSNKAYGVSKPKLTYNRGCTGVLVIELEVCNGKTPPPMRIWTFALECQNNLNEATLSSVYTQNLRRQFVQIGYAFMRNCRESSTRVNTGSVSNIVDS